jgi:hypothetical protein
MENSRKLLALPNLSESNRNYLKQSILDCVRELKFNEEMRLKWSS